MAHALPPCSPVPGGALPLCSPAPQLSLPPALLSTPSPFLAAACGLAGSAEGRLCGGSFQGSFFCPQGLAHRPRNVPGPEPAARPWLPPGSFLVPRDPRLWGQWSCTTGGLSLSSQFPWAAVSTGSLSPLRPCPLLLFSGSSAPACRPGLKRARRLSSLTCVYVLEMCKPRPREGRDSPSSSRQTGSQSSVPSPGEARCYVRDLTTLTKPCGTGRADPGQPLSGSISDTGEGEVRHQELRKGGGLLEGTLMLG